MVQAPLHCVLEVRDRKLFQAEGHYVNSTVRGDSVYLLTYRPRGEQILRTQGETLEEAAQAMTTTAMFTLYALWARDRIQSENQKQYYILHAEVARLADYLASHYPPGQIPQDRPAVDAAITMMERARRVWWVRLAEWFWGAKTKTKTQGGTPE